jgi:hypothetical protein
MSKRKPEQQENHRQWSKEEIEAEDEIKVVFFRRSMRTTIFEDWFYCFYTLNEID